MWRPKIVDVYFTELKRLHLINGFATRYNNSFIVKTFLSTISGGCKNPKIFKYAKIYIVLTCKFNFNGAQLLKT